MKKLVAICLMFLVFFAGCTSSKTTKTKSTTKTRSKQYTKQGKQKLKTKNKSDTNRSENWWATGVQPGVNGGQWGATRKQKMRAEKL